MSDEMIDSAKWRHIEARGHEAVLVSWTDNGVPYHELLYPNSSLVSRQAMTLLPHAPAWVKDLLT